jgi:single-strand DNA-binding protein
MPNLNKVMLMGNLTRDPQVKHLPNQTLLAEFGLACNRKYKTAEGEEREETTFVDCTAFGRQAEVIQEWCTKGKPIFLEGRLKYDTWDDKNGGGKRSKLSVIVENFQFVGGREDGATNAGAPNAKPHPGRAPDRPAPESKRSGKRPVAAAGAGAGFRQSDIPF